MRLVCYLNTEDLQSLRHGKSISLALVGMSALAIHFDPDEEESKIEEKPRNDRSAAARKAWRTKRARRQNGPESSSDV
jgi:hypothetical protein